MKKTLIKTFFVVSLVVLAVLALASCGHNHSFSEMKVITPATCTEEGEIEYSCDCGYVKKSKLEVLEHTPGAWEVTRQATCTSLGSKSTSCRTCGLKLDSESIPSTSHDIVTVPAKKATCAEVGYSEYEYCTSCTYTTYSPKDKVEHTPGVAATCTTPQFCTVCELEVSPELGHVRVVTAGKDATCETKGSTDKVECSRCKAVVENSIEVPQRAHVAVVVAGKAATCVEEGLSDGLVCLICNEVLVDQIELPKNNEHEYTAASKACKVAGCTYRKDTCKHVDDEDKSTLKKLYDKDPTCTKAGLTEGEYCTLCGLITIEQEIVEPAAHKVEIIEGSPATYTTPGLTDGEKCKTCREIVKQQELIPILALGEEVDVNAASNNGGNLAYTIISGTNTCTITGIGTCTSKNIIIPEIMDGYRVVAIADEAFFGNTTIESVVVSDSVLSVGNKAFAACLNLKKLEISDSADVHEDAFISSYSLTVTFGHSVVYVPAVEAECDVPGRKAHYVCVNCHGRFKDKEAKTAMYDVEVTVAHNFDDNDSCKNCRMHWDDVYVIGIQSVADKKVKLGTIVKDIGLPGVLLIETEDEDVHTISVVWDTSSYKSNEVGLYTVKGYLLTGYYKLAKSITDTITITVEVTA